MSATLPVLGKTDTGAPVIGGVFKLYDTYGLPLWAVLDQCAVRGLVIGWQAFYRDARAAGWKHKTIMTRVRADLTDGGNVAMRDEVLQRFAGMEAA